ncbi:MAG: insulinase family protein [Bdellovibrionales bacterium]|nr:insulinase family protein [Bdellovibrionales bacterium]
MRTESFSLPNGIQGIAISIPKAKLASIGVSLPVGYFDDPAQHPGLAHYLEHMLFMGSSKFPSESDYRDFVENRGGNSNAFTSKHETNYQLLSRQNICPKAWSASVIFSRHLCLMNPF